MKNGETEKRIERKENKTQNGKQKRSIDQKKEEKIRETRSEAETNE